MEFWIPYGRTEVPVKIPDSNFYRVVDPPKPRADSRSIEELVRYSLENPVGGSGLASLLGHEKRTAIITDLTMPEAVIGPAIGVLKSILASLGSRISLYARSRSSSLDRAPLGEFRTVEPLRDQFSDLGRTSRGTRVMIQEEIASADCRLLVGLIRPHFATGFSGGPDLLVPGVSSLETITANRSLLTGHLPGPWNFKGNPVYLDSLEASEKIAPVFLVGLVPDGWGGVDSVHSGLLESAFNAGVNRYLELHTSKLDSRPDIVVVSAESILGEDLYHAVRILPNVWEIVKRDSSTVILAGECSRGIGSDAFLDISKNNPDRKAMVSSLRKNFQLGGHVAFTLREALDRSRVQLVSVLPDLYTRSFGLKPSRTVSAAVQSAVRVEGKDAKVLLIPHGTLTIPALASSQTVSPGETHL